MAFDIEAAKADGYTDEEIQNYLANKQIPIEDWRNQPTMNRHEQNVGIAQAAGGAGIENIIGVGEKALEYGAVPAALGYGAYKSGILRPSVPTNSAMAQGAQAAEAAQGAQAAQGYRVAGTGTSPIRYNIPTSVPSGSNTIQFPSNAPVAPESIPVAEAPASAQAARASTLAEQGMAYARQMQQMASEFAQANAGKLLRGGVGIGAALYPSATNQNEQEELARRRAMGYRP